jgi:predicted F0F1-ATPase subunit
MNPVDEEEFRRADARARARRDIERRRRRAPESHFWRSLALVGSVGWPIVLLATGGALLGWHLDHRWATGVRFTLALLSIGTTLGTWAAFHAVKSDR